jgi:nicotinic acid mononucleotide adenylyltransferase
VGQVAPLPGGGPARPVPGVKALVPLAVFLRGLDPEAPPRAAQVCGPPVGGVRRVVAVPGSFNPPHRAHLALLGAGLAAAGADVGAFVLSGRTVDKEQVSGMLLEDRLWLLCRLAGEVAQPAGGAGAAGRGPAVGVVATNRGLYVDQARALRALYVDAADLAFVVGFDKIVQIFDPRYYEDRDAALDALFAAARFLVAPRDEFNVADLDRLMARPENQRFGAGVTPLALDPSLARVSSTGVRTAGPGDPGGAGAVPDLVRRFIAESGCYLPADGRGAYAQRERALAALISGGTPG